MEYKNTLNLPKTDLPIKANLPKLEAVILDFWENQNLYRQLCEKNKNGEKYILHDGPPYPNGDIHLGHALNKILKDIIVKLKNLEGYFAPFLPGWDCHGLPIETQMIKKLGLRRKNTSPLEFRKKCYEYAMEYVDIQRRQFKRLGVLGDWANPYLTVQPEYEAKVLEVFGGLAEAGYIYKSLKPIHWCPRCETALAEAEIEYEDDPSHSIYVKFLLKNLVTANQNLKNIFKKNQPINFVVWTTTPWTLPANTALALHPDFEYVLVEKGTEIYILAEDLLEQIKNKLNLGQNPKILGKFKGREIENSTAAHPFFSRESLVITGHLVTLEQGTGIVHIAPGHGQEDHEIGLHWKLPMIMPVDDSGHFTKEAEQFEGLRYDEANEKILEVMKENGNLIFNETILHPYPHCWRCKGPLIFRATEQWFVSMDEPGRDGRRPLRMLALQEIKKTRWIPDWGQNRIEGMVETRPDWCISRQRTWGVPIPAFYCEKCGTVHFKGKFLKAVLALVRKEGTDTWFAKEAAEILPENLRCEKCGHDRFRKETDIMDVWLESGSSHVAVLETKAELRWPADLYLEGSDQHRGWFQSSLLAAVGTMGKAPYKAVLTHGFTVDEKGKKMSKSLGNVVDPQAVCNKWGADILRLWVASADFRNDMASSEHILKQVADTFTKIRNTNRFLLANLYDFDAQKNYQSYENLSLNDKRILLKLNELIKKITKAYEEFEFHVVYHALNEFCAVTLSAEYFDAEKDNLYCNASDSTERRATQTVFHELIKSLAILMAPILSFTAEEIWRYIPGQKPASVFLADFPKGNPRWEDPSVRQATEKVFVEPFYTFANYSEKYSLPLKSALAKPLEDLRKSKMIGSDIEASGVIKLAPDIFSAEKSNFPYYVSVSGVSCPSFQEDKNLPAGTWTAELGPAEKFGLQKCPRCWKFYPNLTAAGLCPRCSEAVGK